MIVTLEGILSEADLFRAVIEANGIGYEVFVPMTTTEKLPALGKKIKLFIHPVYREDTQSLYGFISREERDFFSLLVEKVSGIGPKIALSILSKLSLPVLKNAIAQSDVKLLSQCPGIGKKTAERIVIELRDKVLPVGMSATGVNISNAAVHTGEQAQALQDAVTALMRLGFKLPDADKAARKALDKLGEQATPEMLIRAALG